MLNSFNLISIGEIIPKGTQQTVFNRMFWVFTGLGILVGTVVIGYLFWKSVQYRSTGPHADDEGDDVARPELGVLPSETGGGRHLLVSFSMSAIIVIALIGWSYGSLLYLTSRTQGRPSSEVQGQMDVTIVGHQFYWEFQYHNVPRHNQTLTTRGELRVPVDTVVDFTVTSADVYHTFGIPELKVKTDAIPGQTTTTWLVAHETGSYLARCYELCGAGHSYMTANVTVMKPNAFDTWYTNQVGNGTATNETAT